MNTVASRLLNKQLEKIQSLIETKEEWMEEEYHRKYAHIYELAKLFLRKQDVLLYGGTAINELIPKKNRFYGPKELPDFDVFSTKAKQLGLKAVQYYKTNGYDSVTLTEALHKDSFKCIVAGLTVLDITQVKKKEYDLLKANRQPTSFGLYTVNPDFIRITLHMLLSQPNDAHRWEKLLKRILAFYKAFPPNIKCALSPTDPANPEKQQLTDTQTKVFEALQQVTIDWVRESNHVVLSMESWNSLLPKKTGDRGINLVLESLKQLPMALKPIDVLVELPDTGIDRHFRRIHKDWWMYLKERAAKSSVLLDIKHTDILASPTYGHLFEPKYTYLLYKGYPIVGLFKTDACLSYIRKDKNGAILPDTLEASPVNPKDYLRIGTVQTILRIYLQLLFQERAYKTPHIPLKLSYLECMVNLLTLLSLESMIRPKSGFLNSFILTCYGNQAGLVTLKRERFKRLQQKAM